MITKTTCTSSYYFEPFWLQNEWVQCEIIGREQIQWRSPKQFTLEQVKLEFIEEAKQREIERKKALAKPLNNNIIVL
jgi:hypothetical protein